MECATCSGEGVVGHAPDDYHECEDCNGTGVVEPEMCPQGCGRTTEDPYGGPCKACWDKV